MSRDHVLSLGAIITAMLIANLMYSVTLPLLSLTLSRAGYSETMIGINTIAQPLAALLFTPFIPGLIGRFGAASVMIAALLVFGATGRGFRRVYRDVRDGRSDRPTHRRCIDGPVRPRRIDLHHDCSIRPGAAGHSLDGAPPATFSTGLIPISPLESLAAYSINYVEITLPVVFWPTGAAFCSAAALD